MKVHKIFLKENNKSYEYIAMIGDDAADATERFAKDVSKILDLNIDYEKMMSRHIGLKGRFEEIKKKYEEPETN